MFIHFDHSHKTRDTSTHAALGNFGVNQDGLIELRCGQWARKMVYFWDLISATFLIIQKFTIPQNVNNTSCSDIAEVYLVQFWELQVEFELRYGLRKNRKSNSYSKFPSRKPKPPGVLLAGKFKLQNMYH